MTVSTETFTKARENAKKSILANLEIKGFRKGKVPANIAEQYVTPQRVSAQASEKLIDSNYSEVMKELQTENIISRPQIEVTKISDSELEVTFSSAVYPEIKLPEMKYTAK